MISMEQMREILAHDTDTDMWLLHEDGTITAEPETVDAPVDSYLRPDTWPRYVCRSGMLANLVEARGEEAAYRVLQMQLNNVPKPASLGARLGQAIAEQLTAAMGGTS